MDNIIIRGGLSPKEPNYQRDILYGGYWQNESYQDSKCFEPSHRYIRVGFVEEKKID